MSGQYGIEGPEGRPGPEGPPGPPGDSGGLATINHGATADTTRPPEPIVLWVGSVEPANALDGDLWLDTS